MTVDITMSSDLLQAVAGRTIRKYTLHLVGLVAASNPAFNSRRRFQCIHNQMARRAYFRRATILT